MFTNRIFRSIRSRCQLALFSSLSSAILIGLLTACTAGPASATQKIPPPMTSAVRATPTLPFSMTNVTITAHDSSLDMPTTLPAGWTDITLVNAGSENHAASLVRLHTGVSDASVQQAVAQREEALFPLGSFVGGPNAVQAGKQQEVLLPLQPGRYMVADFVLGKQKRPHATQGLFKFLTVTSTQKDWNRENLPPDDGVITLRDFDFMLPPVIRAGASLLKVSNQGSQIHEITLVKLASGQTVQDAMNALMAGSSGTSPATPIGGMSALDVGTSGWLKANFAPGSYLAFCSLSDSTSGKTHVSLGMVSAFIVQ